MSDELKPCPFCGSPARLAGGPMAQETYSVWCSGPARHSMDYGFHREVAIAAWNTRADLEATASPSIATPLDDPRVKALVDQLRIELASHEDEAGFYDELCNDEAKSYHTNRANKIRAALEAIASPSIAALDDPRVVKMRRVLEIVADGDSKDYTDNCELARAALSALEEKND